MKRLVITYTYRIRAEHRERYLAALTRIRDNAMRLGCLSYIASEDDQSLSLFTETLIYESWLAYEIAGRQGLDPTMEEIFERFEDWIEGGMKSIETRFSTLHVSAITEELNVS
ncbi:MAG: hypothetical protein KC609_11465 [Myxococcales bacterium]|nr:hypothetical protein [Myxococcales bacterium]